MELGKPAKVHNRGPAIRFADLQLKIFISDNIGISIGIVMVVGVGSWHNTLSGNAKKIAYLSHRIPI